MGSRRFKPSEAHRLEDPQRLIWLPPAEVLTRLKLEPGMKVGDIGAGTGYFAIPIAKAIGPSGRLFAVDVEPEMLDKLKRKLGSVAALQNIEFVEGDAINTQLPDGQLDLVLMANVWHELDDPAGALRETHRILRIGGRLAILDWRPDVERPPGPPIEHRIPSRQVGELLQANGWSTEPSCSVGRYSYFLMAIAPRP